MAKSPTVVLGGNRTREIPLTYPAEYNGVIHDKVTVRRMSQDEMQAFITAAAGDGDLRLAMHDLPDVVFDALDPDDADAVTAAMIDMLPRKLKRALASANAAPTEPPAAPAPEPAKTA
jgi:hypothetical protein